MDIWGIIVNIFYLVVFCVVLYIIYRLSRWIWRLTAPEGHRIKHHMLRGEMMQKYGKKDGKKIYNEMVGVLRKRGYR